MGPEPYLHSSFFICGNDLLCGPSVASVSSVVQSPPANQPLAPRRGLADNPPAGPGEEYATKAQRHRGKTTRSFLPSVPLCLCGSSFRPGRPARPRRVPRPADDDRPPVLPGRALVLHVRATVRDAET